MDTTDLIDLWILNELVLEPSRISLSRLIYDGNEQATAYWAFPNQEARRASPDARSASIRKCLDREWLRAYPTSWSHEKCFSPWPTFVTDQVQPTNTELLEQTEVTLTYEGHQKWEAEFQPDWTRFWKLLSEFNDQNPRQTTLRVVYAGDEILSDLCRWLPSYRDFDDEAGLQVMACHTVFQYRATLWKVLPCAKVITLLAQSDDGLRRLMPKELDDLPYDHELKREARIRSGEYFRDRIEKSERAKQVLRRLSKRWGNENAPKADNPDPE